MDRPVVNRQLVTFIKTSEKSLYVPSVKFKARGLDLVSEVIIFSPCEGILFVFVGLPVYLTHHHNTTSTTIHCESGNAIMCGCERDNVHSLIINGGHFHPAFPSHSNWLKSWAR